MAEILPKVVFVLGGPGSGKGTYCARLVSDFGMFHVSAGDCLREEMADPDSEEGAMIASHIKNGSIVPVATTIKLLLKKIASRPDKGAVVLVDGFPRNEDNLSGWRSIVGDRCDVVFCLYLRCSEETMLRRLMKRGETSGRTDDNETTIRRRFQTFNSDTIPIVDEYRSRDKLVEFATEEDITVLWPDFSRLIEGALSQ